MLINLCFHVGLTFAVFAGGVNQTRSASVCQAVSAVPSPGFRRFPAGFNGVFRLFQVGILLHYSTLATALWVGVTARNIYKQLTRKAKRYEELDEPPPPPRPMLR